MWRVSTLRASECDRSHWQGAMALHDPAYKLLFSHPQMVRDLLAGFVREDWVKQLDYDTLEKVGSSYVSDNLRTRESDVVWRVRWGERWIYIYLLLEFQSRPDTYMALRMLAYVALLYQDLARGHRIAARGRLPPVLPIVLYNGARPWRAAKDVASLVQEGSRALAPYSPRARYLLVDERHHEARHSANLVSALFRLEHSRTTDDMKDALDALIARLPDEAQPSLRRAFSVWLKDSIMPRVQGGPIGKLKDVREVRSMLSETIQRWKMEFRREGLREGRKEGRKQGRVKGLQEGRQEGLKQGRVQGHGEGLRQGTEQTLLRLLNKRFGELPDWAQQRIREARPQELDDWLERLLDARSIDALIIGETSQSSARKRRRTG